MARFNAAVAIFVVLAVAAWSVPTTQAQGSYCSSCLSAVNELAEKGTDFSCEKVGASGGSATRPPRAGLLFVVSPPIARRWWPRTSHGVVHPIPGASSARSRRPYRCAVKRSRQDRLAQAL